MKKSPEIKKSEGNRRFPAQKACSDWNSHCRPYFFAHFYGLLGNLWFLVRIRGYGDNRENEDKELQTIPRNIREKSEKRSFFYIDR